MRYFVLGVVVLFAFPLIAGLVVADDEDLARQYAPVLIFESEETTFPVDVSYHVDNAALYVVGDGLVTSDPTLEGIADYTIEGFYLDNTLGTISDNAIIADYQSTSRGYTVYARVDVSSGSTVIQYWMFYAFNKGEQNPHEGDWEMVQLVLSGGSPSEVMYSQHHSGQRATWDQVEKDGDHMKVYVSRGSHANYLRSYSGMLGLARDSVGTGRVLTSSKYTLVLLDDEPWLKYRGLWGWTGETEEEAIQASVLGQAGPPGPMYREEGLMWDSPIVWGEGLLPADDTLFLVELLLYNLVLIIILVTILTLAVLLYRIYRRYEKTGLGPRVVSLLYIDGANVKSIGNLLCIVGIFLAIFALFNPWYSIATDIQIAGYETEGMANLMTIDGMNGVEIQVPGLTGPIPMGAVIVPFSLLIGIGLLFFIIATIGVHHSKKLGRKYIYRGIRLLVPVIIIIIALFALNSIPFDSFLPGEATVDISTVMNAIAGSPFGGEQTVTIPQVSGQLQLQWGFSLGGYLLMFSGILLIVSGVVEGMANTEFFESSHVSSIEDKPKKKEKPPHKKENK